MSDRDVAILVFPGSNCEQDVAHALRMEGFDPHYVWHAETELTGFRAAILPGGFAHGDYLRTGAIARFSPVMDALKAFAASDKPILGICNGFQVLAEAGMVPGALHRNVGLRFLCQWTTLVVRDAGTPWTCVMHPGDTMRVPINHYEGNYVPPREGDARVAFTYDLNPNGSWLDTAGVTNSRGMILGMMPHPERACEAWMGSEDGRKVFQSLEMYCTEEDRSRAEAASR